MRTGKGFTRLGLILLVAAIALTGYNVYDSNRAKKISNHVVEQLIPLIDEEAVVPEEDKIPDYHRYPDMEMPVIEVDGEFYVGYLEIPDLDLVLPIAAGEWNYEKLKKTPCLYSGNVYQNTMVIAGHNYNTHFGNLRRLSPDSHIRFIDAAGNVFSYTVDWTETIVPADRERMITSDGWDLTLFTCTLGGENRYTLRCVLESEYLSGEEFSLNN